MTSPANGLTLVSFDLCPYVQRAAIALAEKGAAFERVNIDLANKPAWFMAISPLGKVPLLKVGDDVIFESTVIVEYLEDTLGPALHPADPLQRAKHRAFMEFGSSILSDIWIIETTADTVTFEAKRKLVAEKFAHVETMLGSGPFFNGSAFSLVDCVFAPAFRYFDVFDRYADLQVFEGLPKVMAWRKALAGRPSVRRAVPPDYADLLTAFLLKQNGVLAGMMTETGSKRASA
ncbi:MAG: glutathione S-transferase family protein [Rhizobiales bacterium]|nr:glutathione S-transferase family protein [Hyphomicrobiales bacterium]